MESVRRGRVLFPLPTLWERQPRESVKAFGAFTLYRDTPAVDRSISKVAQTLHVSKTFVSRWSTRFAWVARASAWDDEQDRHKRAAQTHAIEQMAERHAATAQLALQAVSAPISVYLRRLRAYQQRPEDDPERMDFELQTMDVDALFRLMFRAAGVMPDLVGMERVSRGQPTEVHALHLRYNRVICIPHRPSSQELVQPLSLTGKRATSESGHILRRVGGE